MIFLPAPFTLSQNSYQWLFLDLNSYFATGQPCAESRLLLRRYPVSQPVLLQPSYEAKAFARPTPQKPKRDMSVQK